MHYLLPLLYSLLFIFSGHSPAFASQSALTASPAILESVLNTKEPTSTIITIQNNTNFPLPIKASVSSFLATDTIIEDPKNIYNASKWFSLDPADFILQPNEVKPIQVNITAPPDAEPGGHYATIFFRPLIPQEAVSTGGAISLARIGVLTFLIVPGEMEEKIEIGSLTAPSFVSFGPIKYFSTITNTGTIHLLPRTEITITNIWGKVIHTAPLDPSLILPKTTKEKNYLWNKKLGFGPYQATLTTTYGTNLPQLRTSPVTTWVIPYPLILGIMILLTLVYKVFIVNRRRLSLALKVLKGHYEPSQIAQKNSLNYPRSRRRLNPSLPPRRGRRR